MNTRHTKENKQLEYMHDWEYEN